VREPVRRQRLMQERRWQLHWLSNKHTHTGLSLDSRLNAKVTNYLNPQKTYSAIASRKVNQ
jgi:hypothetical protein